MTNRDASNGDMPNLPWQRREDARESASLTALLAGAELPAGSPPELRPVAEALAVLRAAPASDELSSEAAVLAMFRDRISVPEPGRPRQRRPMLSPLLSVKAAVAAIATAVSLGGVATAAYTGALPAPVQRFAHDIFGAPPAAVGTHPGTTPTTAGSAASHAAFGLCTAWAHAKAHGTAQQKAVAFRNLAAAAGGAANVTAYCAAVPHPGASPTQSQPGQPTPQPTPHGQPTSQPTPHGTGQPTSQLTPHGTGQPTSQLTPHGTGQPTSHP